MQSKATTVEAYLKELPPDRREAISAVRKVILDSVDDTIEEGMSYGMIGYYIPHRIFPAGYHCNPKMPLPYAALASQKNAMSLYFMGTYGRDGSEENEHAVWLREAWAKTGKKLDMGKCCIRFKKVDDLPLDVVAQMIRRLPGKAYIKQYEGLRDGAADTKAASKPSSKAKAKSKPAAKAKPAAKSTTKPAAKPAARPTKKTSRKK